jgi:uncharacterized membrane protein YecN with MAPEG domain
MPPSHSALYAALSMLLLTALGVRISLIRLRERVFYGDGDLRVLRRSSRAHAVSVEHLLPLLLLLLIFELLGARKPLVDAFGIAILGSRLVHIFAFLIGSAWIRYTGATLTYLTEAALAGFVLARLAAVI